MASSSSSSSNSSSPPHSPFSVLPKSAVLGVMLFSVLLGCVFLHRNHGITFHNARRRGARMAVFGRRRGDGQEALAPQNMHSAVETAARAGASHAAAYVGARAQHNADNEKLTKRRVSPHVARLLAYSVPTSTGRHASCSSLLQRQGDACAGGLGLSRPACCAGWCADVATDVRHCGACGSRCGFNEACCDGACTDLSRDPRNCGRCGNACYDNTCQFGMCGYY